MPDTNADAENELSVEQWLQIRKEAGLRIDPETAEFMWTWAEALNPYGLYQVVCEFSCIGRTYFARSPGSDIWVEFEDIPDEIREKLWSKLESPAGHFVTDLPLDWVPD